MNLLYELFILGELMDRPMHGYLLREIINIVIGPLRQMSWGALYPLLRRLEADGLIEQSPEHPGLGDRPRKIYRITSAGQDRFMFLMLRPEEYSQDYPEHFDIKLMKFEYLTPAQRRETLQLYKRYVQLLLGQLLANKRFVTAEAHLTEAERRWILHVLERRIHVLSADLQWVEKLEVELTDR